MSCLPNVITNLEFEQLGCAWEYNYDEGKFTEDLERLGLEYYRVDEEPSALYIHVSEIEDLPESAEPKILADELRKACRTPYAERYGSVKIDWY